MAVLQNIRTNLVKASLNREARKLKRSQRFYNLQTANSIGIVFQAVDEKEYRRVKAYVQQLREEGIKTVKAIGFIEAKELPAWVQVKLEFDFLTRKDLNTLQRSKGTTANNFVSEEFDILIDFTMTDCYPLRWLVALSIAHMKVGPDRKDRHELYDFMIALKEGEGVSHFMNQVNHYLSPNNKQAS